MSRIVAGLLPLHFLHSQGFINIAISNYSGIIGAMYQPASIADNLYLADASLFGTSFYFYNTAFKVNLEFIKGGVSITSPQWKDNYLRVSPYAEKFNIFSLYEVNFPSVRISIAKRYAVGIFLRRRFYFNLDNFPVEAAHQIYTGLLDPTFWKALNVENVNISLTGWNEIGIGLGGIIFHNYTHLVKGGFNLKMVRGLGNLYAHAQQVFYHFSDSNTLTFKADVRYGHSDGLRLRDLNYVLRPYLGWRLGYSPVTPFSPALDLGIVYEWRPRWRDYTYEMDGNPNRLRENVTKYTIRTGISIVDIGRLRFTRGQYSHRFYADIENWDIYNLQWNSINDFDDTVRKKTQLIPEGGTYLVELPTSLILTIDVKPFKGLPFYGGYTAYLPFMRNKNPEKIHGMVQHTLIARMELPGLVAGIPITYYPAMKHISPGLFLKLGPFWLAWNKITLPFLKGWVYGMDFQFGVHFGIFSRPPSDRDSDHVSDKKDECPETPGLWTFKGCPDSDGDGVEDRQDKCPAVAGPARFQGCPDSDNDGIADLEDECIYRPGPPETKGCPDMDGDGVLDDEDLCPQTPGPKEWNGCPDSDNDSIPDFIDECPNIRGVLAFNGCPPIEIWLIDPTTGAKIARGIRTREGVFYFPKLEMHKVLKFKIEFPEAEMELPGELLIMTETDTGIAVISIHKTKLANLFEYLPPKFSKMKLLEEEEAQIQLQEFEKAIVEKAMKNLKFNYNSAVINPHSFPYLDSLAELLIAHSDWRIRLEGHTDSIGSEIFNLELSKRRAEAVASYLKKKGISEERIIIRYYGESRPIAPNDTEENRAKNRRVEMVILQPTIKVKESKTESE